MTEEQKGSDDRSLEERMREHRIETLREKYKHVRKGAESITPNGFNLYFKTDNKPKNQGRCFYNYNVDTYYVGVRKWRNNNTLTFMEIERENVDTGHTTIIFYISGITYTDT